MRLFERIFVLLLAGIAVLQLGGAVLARGPWSPVFLPVLLPLWMFPWLLAVLLLHLWREGAHWQMYPAYAAGGLFVIVSVTDILVRGSLVYELGSASVLLSCIASLALHWLAPMFRLPGPTGGYAVGTRILHMVDATRDAEGGRRPGSRRELMVQVWYPAEKGRGPRAVYRRRAETTRVSAHHAVLRTQSRLDAPVAPAGRPFPLLVFNPAWTGQRTQSTFLMQELASHGYIVASIDHTFYSGLVAFPDGRVFDSRIAPALGDFTHLGVEEGIALADQYVEILAEDTVFVAEQFLALADDPAGFWHGAVDAAKVAALGHSLGGAAAAEAAALSPLIRAALNLDGWTFGQVLRSGLARPWMVIYGKGIEIEPENLAAQPIGAQRYWEMNRRNRASVTAHVRESGGTILSLEGASHWNFSDRPLYSPLRRKTQAGTIAARRAHRIIADLAIAFFAEALEAGPQRVTETVARYPEVQRD